MICENTAGPQPWCTIVRIWNVSTESLHETDNNRGQSRSWRVLVEWGRGRSHLQRLVIYRVVVTTSLVLSAPNMPRRQRSARTGASAARRRKDVLASVCEFPANLLSVDLSHTRHAAAAAAGGHSPVYQRPQQPRLGRGRVKGRDGL